MSRPKLIVLEGIEGSGKTTVINRLKEEGYEDRVDFFHEQGQEHLPFIYREPSYWLTRLLIYANIEQALKQGRTVVVERSYLTGYVYKTFGFEPLLMRIIYRGIGIDPADVLVVLLDKEEAPPEQELALHKYRQLLYATPNGEQIVAFNSIDSAVEYLKSLIGGEEDDGEGNRCCSR